MRVLIIIPVYNEEKNIAKVLNSTKKFGYDILVVNDGSTDRTQKIILKLKVNIIQNKTNLGKGASLRKGFEFAIKNNYETIIIIDGDGEHNPKYIPEIIKKIKEKDVIFSQRKDYRKKQRYLLNKFTSIWIKLLDKEIKDYYSGFIGIKKSALKKMQFSSKRFEIELEIILESIKHNLKKDFIDIKPTYNKKSGVKFKDYIKINNFFDIWIIKNIKFIKKNIVIKTILITLSLIGLLFGNIITFIKIRK